MSNREWKGCDCASLWARGYEWSGSQEDGLEASRIPGSDGGKGLLRKLVLFLGALLKLWAPPAVQTAQQCPPPLVVGPKISSFTASRKTQAAGREGTSLLRAFSGWLRSFGFLLWENGRNTNPTRLRGLPTQCQSPQTAKEARSF